MISTPTSRPVRFEPEGANFSAQVIKESLSSPKLPLRPFIYKNLAATIINGGNGTGENTMASTIRNRIPSVPWDYFSKMKGKESRGETGRRCSKCLEAKMVMPYSHLPFFILGFGLALGVQILLNVSSAGAGSLTGPILQEGLTVVLEDYHQLPSTSANKPLARVNFLREAPDGTGRIFVNDMRGPLYIIEAGVVSEYMDVAQLIPDLNTGGDLASGFVSFALAPDFATTGHFYTVHSEDPGTTPPNLTPPNPTTILQHSVLVEWTATDPSANTFAGTRRELIRVGGRNLSHTMGEIAFNPLAEPGDADYGLLYILAGDYSSVNHSESNQLQRKDSPFGVLMRIDPLGGPFVRNTITYEYGIPNTNPFANDPDPVLGEIYAYGFRNGHRIAWDLGGPSPGPYVSDIGEQNIEEVNRLVAGRNYGWAEREGTFEIDVDGDPGILFPLPADDATFGFTYPVAQFDHDEGFAIAGGMVYRGSAGDPLNGKFIFGDIVTGRMFYADVQDLLDADDGDPTTTAQLYRLNLEHNGQLTTFRDIVADVFGLGTIFRVDLRYGQDAQGQIYVTTKQDGFIRKLTWNGVPAGPPETAASNPTPTDGATEINLDSDLSWDKGIKADSHDVYFGTNPNPGATEFQGNQTESTFDPGELAPNTTYYWRIDAKNQIGTTTGPVWSFSTETDDPNAPLVLWEATTQIPNGSWRNSGWDNRSFRILLDGSVITNEGSQVRLFLRGRTSGSYTIQGLSLMHRDGNTLNGIPGTRKLVTFGQGNTEITVQAGELVGSDPINFDVVPGQDLFLTYWAPTGAPGIYRNGGSGDSAWVIVGSNESETENWEALTISDVRSYIYVAERLEVVPANGGNPPTIITPPANVTVLKPDPATFNVEAEGDPPLTYQWYRGSSEISGATGPSYTLAQTDLSDDGATFSVVVTNVAGSASSSSATLTVEDAPNILTQPSNVTVVAPASATFTVVATGSPPPSYQWRENGVDINGATNASYTTGPTQLSDSGSTYSVVVSNSRGTENSLEAVLTVVEAPIEPVLAWEAAGQNAGGSWSNSGWDHRSFRILLDGDFISTGGSSVQLTFRGRTAGSYTIQGISLVQRDGNTLNGVESTHQPVTFGGGNAEVTVSAGEMVTSDPIPFEVLTGQDLFLTYWVPPGEPSVYRNGGTSTSAWIISDSDESGTNNWEGLSITTTRSHVYIIERLEVLPPPASGPPQITSPPTDQVVNFPGKATFNVTATGTAPLMYQWRKNEEDIVGATGTTYMLDPAPLEDSGAQFDVVVTNSEGSVTSSKATLTVLPAPVLSWEAAAQNPAGTWSNSGWDNRSFRILLKGDMINNSGSSVRLILRPRTSGSYTIQGVSLVQRDGSTLNGIPSSQQAVTFGGGNTEVTVPAGETVMSDTIPFDLLTGQDLFLTYWVPVGQPTVYRNGGTSTSAWIISGTDESATNNWEGLSFTTTRSHVYVLETLEVVP